MVLPNSDNVARYCKPTTVDKEKPTTAAFEFRPRGDTLEQHLSVDWLEFLHPQPANTSDQLATLRQFLKTPHGLPILSMRPSGYFAVLPVARIHVAVTEIFPTILQCNHEPRNGAANDPHACIRPQPGVDRWPKKGSDPAHLAIQQYLFLSMSHWEKLGEAIP